MALDTLRALAERRVPGGRGERAAGPRLPPGPGRPPGADVVPDPPQPGMNAALAYGADRLREAGFGHGPGLRG